MLRQRREFHIQIRQVVDAVLLVASLYLTYWIRVVIAHLFPDRITAPFPMSAYAWLFIPIIIVWPLLLEMNGYYRRAGRRPDRHSMWVVLKSATLGVMVLIFISYTLRIDPPISRILMVGYGAISVVALLARDWAVWASDRPNGPGAVQRLLLVGNPRQIADLEAVIRDHPDWRAEIVGWMYPKGGEGCSDDEKAWTATPCLGDTSKITDRLHEQPTDAVVLDVDRSCFSDIEEVIWACEIEGVEAWVLADFVHTSIARAALDDFYGRPTLVFRTTPAVSWQLLVKRVIDIIGSAALLVLTSPIMLLTAIAIRVTSPGPILFRQTRSGLHGEPFTMYKFRSMVTNAEMLRKELERYNEMSGPVFKIDKDPRLTPVGRFIRRFSIDELPQLWNVLLGQMSLVGPRPPIPTEVEEYETWQRRRLSMKPGLTCIWQVSGRNEIQFDEWMQLDLRYIDSWSLWLDVKILFRTVPVVLFGMGGK